MSSIDHLAICVTDLEAAIKVYENIGFEFSDQREKVPEQGVVTAFAPFKNSEGGHIELLAPLQEGEGPIAQFMAKKGPGIHHLALKVADIEAETARLKALGLQFIYDSPKEGAGQKLINFIHPKSTGGVLIEICQPKDS